MNQSLKVSNFVNEVLDHLDPYKNFKRMIKFYHRSIEIQGEVFEIKGKLHIFSTGKASSYELDAFLNAIKESECSIDLGELVSYTKDEHQINSQEIFEIQGTHPVISERNIKNTQIFIERLEKIKKEDSLVFLLSGGASALLEKPIDGISFDDLQKKHRELLKSGKNINEMNKIRKELSSVKDGKLLDFIKTKNILQLITCDIPNERLEDVSSGPLLSSVAGQFRPLTFKTQSASSLIQSLSKKNNRLVGSVYDCSLEEMQHDLLNNLPNGIDILISGGEAPIELPENAGLGGRNTHFVLSFAEQVYKNPQNRDIHILSIGTDGGDGPTDAAGSYINYEIYNSKDSIKYLEDFNSYGYFKEVGSLVKTGPTKTNVMDIRFIWRE